MLEAQPQPGVEWVQIDEPIFVAELEADWQHALRTAGG